MSAIVPHLAYGPSGRAKITALYDTHTYPTTWMDWSSIYGIGNGQPQPYSGHNGVDAQCWTGSGIRYGAKIYSIFTGKVTEIFTGSANTYSGGSSDSRGTGVCITSTVSINGQVRSVQVYYYHMRSSGESGYDGVKAGLKVTKGQVIEAGSLLGYQGNTGKSSGEHLHIGVKVNGSYWDPYPFITGVYSGMGVTDISSDTGSNDLSLSSNNSGLSSSGYIPHSGSTNSNQSTSSLLALNNQNPTKVLNDGSNIGVTYSVGNGGSLGSSSTMSILEAGTYPNTTLSDEDLSSNPYNNYDCYFRLLHLVSVSGAQSKWWLPSTPDDITERVSAEYSEQGFMGRSSPYQVYLGTSSRAVSFSVYLHRDMVKGDPSYIERIVAAITSAAYPIYKVGGEVVPPAVEFSFGKSLTLRGVLASVEKTWGWPIINNQHMSCTLAITLISVPTTPATADVVYRRGSMRE